MKRSEAVIDMKAHLRAMHMGDLYSFGRGEMSMGKLLEKMAETAIESAEVIGMRKPPYIKEIPSDAAYTCYAEVLEEWEPEDET